MLSVYAGSGSHCQGQGRWVVALLMLERELAIETNWIEGVVFFLRKVPSSQDFQLVFVAKDTRTKASLCKCKRLVGTGQVYSGFKSQRFNHTFVGLSWSNHLDGGKSNSNPGAFLGCDIGGAKELGVIYFPTNGGAKEPRNLPNHRVVFLRKWFDIFDILFWKSYRFKRWWSRLKSWKCHAGDGHGRWEYLS